MDMVLVGRIERAMAPFGREQVEGRRCGLFRRRLRGDLLLVVEMVWMLEMRKGRCVSWTKKRMEWQAESLRW